MQLLKELMAIGTDKQLSEAKKATDKKGMLKMLPLKSFVAGNMVMSHRSDEDDEPIEESKTMKKKVEVPKARSQQLNQVLGDRKGGPMYDAKRDYVRAKEKQKTRTTSDE